MAPWGGVPDEVLATTTAQDLVAGSGLGFTERGAQALKRVPGSGGCFWWRHDPPTWPPTLDNVWVTGA